MECLHCRRSGPIKARGLCYHCWVIHHDEYPRLSTANHDDGLGHTAATIPAEEPTTATPGTAGKVEALAARAEAGQMLWHQEDGMADLR